MRFEKFYGHIFCHTVILKPQSTEVTDYDWWRSLKKQEGLAFEYSSDSDISPLITCHFNKLYF